MYIYIHTHTHTLKNPLDAKTRIKNRRPNDENMHKEGWQRETSTAASSGCTQKRSQPTHPPSGRAHGAALRGGRQPTHGELRRMRSKLYKYK